MISSIFSLMFCSLKAIHCIIEFLTSVALELPCVFTTNPFNPNIGAPPYCSKSNDFKVSFNAGFTKSAPILLRRFVINPAFTVLINVEPTPSYNFKITLPTKASQTITSATPFGISLASTLPTKFISGQFLRSGNVSFTSALPFSSSEPMLDRSGKEWEWG